LDLKGNNIDTPELFSMFIIFFAQSNFYTNMEKAGLAAFSWVLSLLMAGWLYSGRTGFFFGQISLMPYRT